MKTRVFVVIPAKDEATRIGGVIRETMRQGYQNIIVVNDGSTDNTAEVARSYGAMVLTHIINLGAGAATQTGIEYALERGAEVIVTIDADQQHFPSDIKRLVRTLRTTGVDVVIGSRFLNQDNDIPKQRQLLNRIGNHVTHAFAGMRVTDSQSGLKAFRAAFARRAQLSFNGYEFCTEFIRLMREQRATFREIPIQVMYDEHTLNKGQSVRNGFRMAVNFLRYHFS